MRANIGWFLAESNLHMQGILTAWALQAHTIPISKIFLGNIPVPPTNLASHDAVKIRNHLDALLHDGVGHVTSSKNAEEKEKGNRRRCRHRKKQCEPLLVKEKTLTKSLHALAICFLPLACKS